jgi:hypothetical protein
MRDSAVARNGSGTGAGGAGRVCTHRRRRGAAAWIASVVAFAIAACSTGEGVDSPGGDPVTYRGDGIAFSHPPEWAPLEGLTTGDGLLPAGGPITVGRIDEAGNLIGVVVLVAPVTPPIPPGEEDGYLAAALERQVEATWGAATVRETGPAYLDGRPARRHLIDAAFRGEPVTAEVIVAAAGAEVIVMVCQAPSAGFDAVVPWCSMAAGTLRVDAAAGSGPDAPA